MKITFNKNYFALTVLLFVIEVLIALFVRDNFVRPYLGDVLVVILLYCFVKSFIKLPIVTVGLLVLAVAFLIEWFQYMNIVEKLHLEKSTLAKTVLGTSFSWMDMLTYVVGIAIVLGVEKYLVSKE
jgi:hypothetical protein